MTFDPKEARALVERLDGYTPGPWKWWTACSWMRLTSSGRNAREGDILLPFVNQYDRHPDMDVSKENAALISAAPDLHAHLTAALDEIKRLMDGIDAIRQYGSDTLSGPLLRADDTREWQRAAVNEMTRRSRNLLSGNHWDFIEEGDDQ